VLQKHVFNLAGRHVFPPAHNDVIRDQTFPRSN
jgi:hypothetical protein